LQSTRTPQSSDTPDDQPGTSGTIQKEVPREKSVERYRATDKAMTMSPEGKLIPFRTLDRVTKDDRGRKEEENISDPPKYKYIL